MDEAAIHDLAEEVPGGPATKRLTRMASRYGVALRGGLVEKEQGKIADR